MSAEIIVLCLVIGIASVFLFKKIKKIEKQRSHDSNSPTPAECAEPQKEPAALTSSVEPPKRKRTYEEWEQEVCAEHGSLPCDGIRCTPYVRCSPIERLFCRDVLTKAVEGNFFSGQYTVRLPSGNYRLDFAVGTRDGRRIAIEFDGFHAHARELEPAEFSKQLQRQNELVLAGWQILRFSYFQLINRPDRCRHVLRKAIAPVEADIVPLRGPLPHAEVRGCSDPEAAKRCGLVYSDLRGCWYINNLNEVDPSVPDDWHMKVWASCPNRGCAGQLEVRQRRDDKRYFWYCPVCNETFNDRSGGQRRAGPLPKKRDRAQ